MLPRCVILSPILPTQFCLLAIDFVQLRDRAPLIVPWQARALDILLQFDDAKLHWIIHVGVLTCNCGQPVLLRRLEALFSRDQIMCLSTVGK